MITLAIDPGIRSFGAAVFADTWLTRATLIRGHYNPKAAIPGIEANEPFYAARAAEWLIVWLNGLGLARNVNRVVIEIPKVYPAAQQKGDQNDLIALAGFAYALATSVHSATEIVRYFPREWKGTIDADTMTARIEKRLMPAETHYLEPCPESLRHNMIDAVGIGLFNLGRLDRHRVIPR